MHHTPCTYCGRPVVWAQDVNGSKIPLDAKFRVFAPRGSLPASGTVQVMALKQNEAMSCHFDTCGKNL